MVYVPFNKFTAVTLAIALCVSGANALEIGSAIQDNAQDVVEPITAEKTTKHFVYTDWLGERWNTWTDDPHQLSKINSWLEGFDNRETIDQINDQPLLIGLIANYFEFIGEPTAYQKALRDGAPVCLSPCKYDSVAAIEDIVTASSSSFVEMMLHTKYGYEESEMGRWHLLSRIDDIVSRINLSAIKLAQDDLRYFSSDFAHVVEKSSAASGQEYPNLVKLISVSGQQLDSDETDRSGENSRSNLARQRYTFDHKQNSDYGETVSRLALQPREEPQSFIARYLQQGGRDGRVADNLRVISEHTTAFARTHYLLEEWLDNVRVYDDRVKLVIDNAGNGFGIVEKLASRRENTPLGEPLEPETSLRIALAKNFPDVTMPERLRKEVDSGDVVAFRKGDFFFNEPRVETVLLRQIIDSENFTVTDSVLEYGALVTTWSASTNLLYETVINSNEEIVENRLRTANDSYRVFDTNPNSSVQTIVPGAGAGNGASPNGWLSGNQSTLEIRGNNTHVYLDTNNDNSPDGGGAAVLNRQFHARHDPGQQSAVLTNREVAVQNLFYKINLIHDTLCAHGFVEAVGNFQEFNVGRGCAKAGDIGGANFDKVLAEVQDGGDVNNAFFAVDRDGISPRMIMHNWTKTAPDRDSSLDADIIWHEYTHGVSYRLIDGMAATPESLAIWEGVSDALAIVATDDDVVAEYLEGNLTGIRRSRYSSFPYKLSDYNSGVIVVGGRNYFYQHDNGEIYAAAIWKLWELFQRDGLSRDELFDLLIDGMKNTVARPNYLDMRQGLLNSADDAIDCLVWEAFAAFGMGQGAVFNPPLAIVDSTTIPAGCIPPPRPLPTATKGTKMPENCPRPREVRAGKISLDKRKPHEDYNYRFDTFAFVDPWMEPIKQQVRDFESAQVSFGHTVAGGGPPFTSEVTCNYLTDTRNAVGRRIIVSVKSNKVANYEDTATSLGFVSTGPTGRLYSYRPRRFGYVYECHESFDACKF